MNATRQPLLTVSPSQHLHGSPSKSGEELAKTNNPPQTTPKLPRRERLASFSRLLRNENFSEFTKSAQGNRNGKLAKCGFKAQPPVDIRISPCSPPEKYLPLRAEEIVLQSEKGYLSPNSLPFSPRLLTKRSPINLSPNYKQPSPLRSPLYHPDDSRNFLGRGSFGNVSLCRYKDTDFAVKIIRHSSQYIGERNIMGIRHPHLVQIFHISAVLDKTIIFMEFAGHCNLQRILDTKSELDLRRKLSFCAQIASGLRHLHQNRIVHGDVKPANVMVNPMGICKLGDFGNSTRFSTHAAKCLGHPSEETVGTVAYAAPEVLRGSCSTPQSDIYSFGILLWQVETRDMPFDGEHPHVIIYKVAHYGARPKFPENDDPIISMYARTADCCWQTVPQERIDANQVLSNLRDIMQMIKECNKN